MFSSKSIVNSHLKKTPIHPLGSTSINSLNLMPNIITVPGNIIDSQNQVFPQLRLGSFAFNDCKAHKVKNEYSKDILDLKDKIKEEPIKIEELGRPSPSPSPSREEVSTPVNINEKISTLPNRLQQTFQPLIANNFQIQQLIMYENILRRAKIQYTKHYINEVQKQIMQYSKAVEEESQNIFFNLSSYPNLNQLTGLATLANYNQNQNHNHHNQNQNQNPLLFNLSSAQFPFQQKLHINTTNPSNLSISLDQEQSLRDKNVVNHVNRSKKIKKVFYTERKKSQSELLKNITKNYGKACSKFASSQDGLPYLKKYIIDEEENKEFQEFIKSNAENIKNIPFFRESILVMPNDAPKIAKFKTIFKGLCETFVSKYAVKWIFTSKQLLNRGGHLSYRRKILRRIQDPENFVNLNN